MPKLLPLVSILALFATPAYAATLSEMAGQMVVVGFEGNDVSDASVQRVTADLKDGRIGGVMFLKKNVGSLAAVEAMNDAFRAASAVPPLLTVDQEGGAVERLTEAVGFPEVANARTVAARNSPEEAEAIYARMAKGIAELGFTVNFGPVADLERNRDNAVIAKFGRAFAADAETVTRYDRAFIDAHRAAGVLTSLKHFPGHGSSTADSHEGFVDITRTWSEEELAPYRELIGEGKADMVMVGHLYHADYATDDQRLPASLSPRWIDGVLRDELGFDGVVISDDLEMGAIRDHFTLEETVIRAVSAGMDVLLFSNTAYQRPTLGAEVVDILVKQAEADPDFAARIEASYARILALKTQRY